MLHRPISQIIARRVGRIFPEDEGGIPGWVWQPGSVAGNGSDEGEEAPTRGSVQIVTKRAKLLIVEDDWFVGMDIEAALLDNGYEVVGVVRSADEAVSAALQHQPDLVLMDIRLLGPRDGVDAAFEIRQKANIPSLFVSAHTDDPTKARAAGSRPAGWLTKPFLTQHLLDAVERALESGEEEPDPA